MKTTKNNIYFSVCSLAKEKGCKTLSELKRYYYDKSDCGVSLVFLDETGETIDDSTYNFSRELPNIWAGEICKVIKFSTIIEGSDAEMEAGVIPFPLVDSEIKETIDYLEEYAN
tara:strand:+ start:564 stop:905 length:342 start_codon:yes stop_codon:yes gene_type:complete